VENSNINEIRKDKIWKQAMLEIYMLNYLGVVMLVSNLGFESIINALKSKKRSEKKSMLRASSSCISCPSL